MKRFILLALLFIAVCGVLAARGKKEYPDLDLQVDVLQGPTGVGLVKMIEDEPFIHEDVTTRYTIVPTPDILIPHLLTGETDLAALPTNLAAKLFTSGIEYRLAAIISWGVLYLVGPAGSVDSWADLQGKTVYCPGRGATPDIALQALAAANGLDAAQDLRIDYTYNHIELAQLLIADKIDIALLPEPFVSRVLAAGEDAVIVMDLQSEWEAAFGVPMAQSALVIRADLVDTYPDIAAIMLAKCAESIEWVQSHPDYAGQLVERCEFGIDAKSAETAIPRLNLRYVPAGDARKAVESFLGVLLAAQPAALGGRLPAAEFYMETD